MRNFTATITLTNDAETVKEGLEKAKETLKILGLKGEVKPAVSARTLSQNSALHLFFIQLAQELNEHGLDMRHLIRQEVELQWTPYSIKEYLWRPLQKALTGKYSTTKLDRSQEINLIYNNLNRIIIERSKGEITFPPFPSLETLIDQESNNY